MAKLPSLKELIEKPELRESLPTPILAQMLAQIKEEVKKITKSSPEAKYASPLEMAVDLSNGQWKPAKHLVVLSEWLVDLVEGRRRRLLVSMPPRHGKSELISFWFPLWCLARKQETRVILASYEAEFAAHWGRRVRNAINEFGSELNLTLDPGSAAAHRWSLDNGIGGMLTAGAGGPITGKGADIMVIDDPIKNSEEASSEVIREKLWDWMQTTAYSRLEPGAGIIVVATRWHQDDLIGRLEARSDSGEGLKWDVLKFPALAEREDPLGRVVGEPLWPERYNAQDLGDIQKINTPYNWSALYQQRPTPEEGGAVKRAWWRYYEAPPADFDQIIQSWDLAFKDLKDSDYCVGQVWGRKGAQFFLLHQVRGLMNSVEVVAAIRNITRIFPKATAKLIEDSANGPAILAQLQHEVAGMIPIKTKGQSKDQRLQACIPLIAAGNVYIPGKRRPDGDYEIDQLWVAEYIEELAAFPNGTHDDQLDATTQALNYMKPKGWSTVESAWKEAKLGPPAKTTQEIQNKQFQSFYKKAVKRSEKRINSQSNNLSKIKRLKTW